MAGSRTYRDVFIVLDKTKLRETDLILTLMASDGRRVRAVAKGARKPGSRMAARCELGCSVDLLIARGRSLDVVSQAELVESPLGATPAVEALAAVSAALDVACRCCYEDVVDAYVFKITRAALSALASTVEPVRALVLAAYVFKILGHIGYLPELSRCVACGDADVSYFSAQAGGLLCSSCAHSVPGALRLLPGRAEWLRSLLRLRFTDLSRVLVDPGEARGLLGLAHQWGGFHLDSRLKALEFYLALL